MPAAFLQLATSKLCCPPKMRHLPFRRRFFCLRRFLCRAHFIRVSSFCGICKLWHKTDQTHLPTLPPCAYRPSHSFLALSPHLETPCPPITMVSSRCGTCSSSWFLYRLTHSWCGFFGAAKVPRRSECGRCAPPWRSTYCRWSLVTSPGMYFQVKCVNVNACDCFRHKIV